MHATVWPNRIDILGASGLAKNAWEPLLDDLKAEHVPGLTPTGKRLSAVISPNGRSDVFIYRTAAVSDEETLRVLGKYGIEASLGSKTAET
jgi:hypothetical protein